MPNKNFQSSLWLSCIIFGLMTSLAMAADDKVQLFQKLASTTKAPNLSLFDLNNQNQPLSQYTGQVILLHFWATWCRSCLQELPDLQLLGEKLQDQGLVVIAIAEDSRKAVEPYIQKNRFTLPVWIDQYGEGLRAYNVQVFPTTYLIGRTGNIEGIALGPRQWTNPIIFNHIEKLLDN